MIEWTGSLFQFCIHWFYHKNVIGHLQNLAYFFKAPASLCDSISSLFTTWCSKGNTTLLDLYHLYSHFDYSLIIGSILQSWGVWVDYRDTLYDACNIQNNSEPRGTSWCVYPVDLISFYQWKTTALASVAYYFLNLQSNNLRGFFFFSFFLFSFFFLWFFFFCLINAKIQLEEPKGCLEMFLKIILKKQFLGMFLRTENRK